jgi:hypothetical protein
MRPRHITLAVATLALFLQAADALAVECYEVIDKDQNATYRATSPPFGMDGDEWRAGQDRLRANNLHLRWMPSSDCSPRIVAGDKGVARPKSDLVFDPEVILQSTPSYMTASGRPSSIEPATRR